MSDWARVATFEADNDAVEAMVKEISSAEGPPPDIPAKSITVLADRENGRARIVVRFDSEDNLRTGAATLDAMEPPALDDQHGDHRQGGGQDDWLERCADPPRGLLPGYGSDGRASL